MPTSQCTLHWWNRGIFLLSSSCLPLVGGAETPSVVCVPLRPHQRENISLIQPQALAEEIGGNDNLFLYTSGGNLATGYE